ncbi:hypothetical protein TCAL_15379, partial [Tigriopus californicus]
TIERGGQSQTDNIKKDHSGTLNDLQAKNISLIPDQATVPPMISPSNKPLIVESAEKKEELAVPVKKIGKKTSRRKKNIKQDGFLSSKGSFDDWTFRAIFETIERGGQFQTDNIKKDHSGTLNDLQAKNISLIPDQVITLPMISFSNCPKGQEESLAMERHKDEARMGIPLKKKGLNQTDKIPKNGLGIKKSKKKKNLSHTPNQSLEHSMKSSCYKSKPQESWRSREEKTMATLLKKLDGKKCKQNGQKDPVLSKKKSNEKKKSLVSSNQYPAHPMSSSFYHPKRQEPLTMSRANEPEHITTFLKKFEEISLRQGQNFEKHHMETKTKHDKSLGQVGAIRKDHLRSKNSHDKNYFSSTSTQLSAHAMKSSSNTLTRQEPWVMKSPENAKNMAFPSWKFDEKCLGQVDGSKKGHVGTKNSHDKNFLFSTPTQLSGHPIKSSSNTLTRQEPWVMKSPEKAKNMAFPSWKFDEKCLGQVDGSKKDCVGTKNGHDNNYLLSTPTHLHAHQVGSPDGKSSSEEFLTLECAVGKEEMSAKKNHGEVDNKVKGVLETMEIRNKHSFSFKPAESLAPMMNRFVTK